jgi:hypothetical protein
MTMERTIEGRELRLASRGAGRFVSAGFLAFWLCGWAVGETIVLWLLVKGAIALLTGQPPDPGREPLEVGPAVMVGTFLLLWITLWTFGGIAAITEFLRLVWGEDRILVSGGRLTVTRVRGPFRSRRVFERSDIRSIPLVGRTNRLTVETRHGRIELSSLGSPSERIEGASALRAELNLSAEPAETPGALPPAWEEVITPEGERALVPNRGTRRIQARVAGGVAMVLAIVAFVLGRESLQRWDLAVPSVIALAFAAAAGAGALWLARGRMEWRIGGGRITLRKRMGTKVRDVFEARRLRLESTNDSDGDTWYALYALADGGATLPPSGSDVPTTAPALVRWSTSPPKHSKTIARLMDDAESVRDLGRWLSRVADIPLEDHSTSEAQAADLAQLRVQLEQSGRFGKWAAKVIDRLEQSGRKSSGR